jgi:hypothetical protein
VVHGFIKPGSLARRSTSQIKNVKGYSLDLISGIGFDLDDAGESSSSGSDWPRQSTRVPWLPA